MRYPYIAICDQEEDYAKKLAEYFQKEEYHFRVGVFSKENELTEFMKNHKVDIMLISESMARKMQGQDKSETKILLDEGSGDTLEYSFRIYKYQKAENILNEMLAILSETENLMHGKNISRKSKTHIFYTPVKKCSQAAVSWDYARRASERKKVLYVSLDTFSDLEERAGTTFSDDLTDLVCFSKQDTNQFAYQISSAKRTIGNLDLLPVVRNPEDLMSIEKERWKTFFAKIKETCFYDLIVIELGEPIKGFLELLGGADRLIQIILSEKESQARIRRYEALLEFTGYQFLKEITSSLYIQNLSLEKEQSEEIDRCMEDLLKAG